MSKWIMNKEMHLGFIRQTVGKGSIIEHDEDKNVLVIDGVTYDVVKDLNILRKHGLVLPYDESAASIAKKEANTENEAREARIREHKGKDKDDSQKMEIVRDDSEDHPMIDISHTKKQNHMPREINNDMEVIKGDEDPSERQAKAEELKEEQNEDKPEKMPIVQDDSLGNVVGEASLNQTATPKSISAEEHEKIRQENQNKAKNGFVDNRIKQALDAANSINKKDTGTVDVESGKELSDIETPQAVAVPEPGQTKEASASETQNNYSDLADGLDLSKL